MAKPKKQKPLTFRRILRSHKSFFRPTRYELRMNREVSNGRFLLWLERELLGVSKVDQLDALRKRLRQLEAARKAQEEEDRKRGVLDFDDLFARLDAPDP